MTGNDIRHKYINFFVTRGHREIPPAPIVPLNDPTTLFTPFGMQQLVPYLKGEPHPMGTRLVDSQPSFRSEDIDEVGDNRHTTFFEMLGNWSLGDYFKKEQLPWIFTFVTEEIGLDPARLYATVFEGDAVVPADAESIQLWQSLFKTGAPAKPGVDGFDPQIKIYTYPAKKNWWSRAGVPENMPVGEIGGPDSELFYDFGADLKLHENSPYKNQPCHVNCDCGRFMEIGNSVFMEYIKQPDGSFQPLPKQNVDFGGGLERLTAASQNTLDVFLTDMFQPIIKAIETATGKLYADPVNQPPMRIIADHLKAATFLIAGGVEPANKLQGYFLRRLIRRVIVKIQRLKGDIRQPVDSQVINRLINAILDIYTPMYFAPDFDRRRIIEVVTTEGQKFAKTLNRGLFMIEHQPSGALNGKFAFDLYQSYGFPVEVTEELVREKGIEIDKAVFREEFTKHQEKSRSASQGLFKGGLADHSDTIVKYHTATHLLHQALRQVLGPHVQQMGSNITADRLRFDFKHPEKLTDGQKQQIEKVINEKITEDLPVQKTIENKDTALQSGALAFFREKYPDTVSVYTIGRDPAAGWFSKELCGGPHVTSTGQIGPVRIKKEEAVGAGVRRIYMVLAPTPS